MTPQKQEFVIGRGALGNGKNVLSVQEQARTFWDKADAAGKD